MPGGARGVALKSKFPKRAAYADRDGFRLAERNKLSVILHNDMRKLRLILTRSAFK